LVGDPGGLDFSSADIQVSPEVRGGCLIFRREQREIIATEIATELDGTGRERNG
jgi:hypothetical protein